MKAGPTGNREAALTKLEVLVVVAVLILLGFLLLQRIARRNDRSSQVICWANLHKITLAFNQWALDHDGKFPAQVSVTKGGSKEFVATGEVFRHFQLLSNSLITPAVLVCPADKPRQAAGAFTGAVSNTNLSYFVNVDAGDTMSSALVTGDRNLTNGSLLPNRIMELKSDSVVGWTAEMHHLQGNVGLLDGSVQTFSTPEMRRAVNSLGTTTDRLAIP